MGFIIYKDKEQRLSGGVLLLLISNLAVKVVGLLFKIPLVNIIGDEGMGYFNSAYTVYTLFYTLSTAGLPVAVSILISQSIAEGGDNKKRIFNISSAAFFVTGLLGSLLMLFLGGALARGIGSERSDLSIEAMSFVLLFVCISSGVRGYFQGHQNMLPTAVSQIIEAVGKLAFGIIFSLYALRCGWSSHVVAAFAILGITLSSAISMLYLLAVKNKFDKKEMHFSSVKGRASPLDVIRRLWNTALPITVSSSVMSLTGILDLSMVMRRLISIGYTQNEATAMYGNYSGLAVPLFNLPSAVIAPIALSVVPYITAARTEGNFILARSTVKSAMRVTLLLAFPCAFGLSVMSLPILGLIFNGDSANRAAPLLSLLATGVVGVGMTTVTTAILQSYQKNRLPIISMLTGSAVKLVLGYILIGKLGMSGAALSTLGCYTVTLIINLLFVKKYTGVKLGFLNDVIKPLFSSFLACFCGRLLYGFAVKTADAKICCLLSLAVTVVLYFFIIVIINGIDEKDAALIPGGRFVEKYVCSLYKGLKGSKNERNKKRVGKQGKI